MLNKGMIIWIVIMALMLSACGGTSDVKELSILWAEWYPADSLQQIGDMYEQETGIKVTVIQVDWVDFWSRYSDDMAAKDDTWDMVMGDTQWLGQAVTSGWYVDLTDLLANTGLRDSVTQASLTYYGEYPISSGKYWAFPAEGDPLGWAYRTDLFENPDEQAAFKEKYGYDLAAPETYQQLKDIAEFFTRPEQNLYGVAIFNAPDIDGITEGVGNAMFAWGGDWWDPLTNQVMGIVNSPQNVEAVQFYRDLHQCCQFPGGDEVFIMETSAAMTAGQVAMAMNYSSLFRPLLDQATNPNYYDKLGFFPNPKGPAGLQGAILGGQSLSINAFISPQHQEAAKAFIQWFGQEEIQAKWGELGGGTCNANVLKSDQFLNASPINPAFATGMTFVKDIWNIAIYGQLLEVTQREFGKFVVDGTGTAQETMDTIAAEHDKILRENGYIK